jgi:hypothetical protein
MVIFSMLLLFVYNSFSPEMGDKSILPTITATDKWEYISTRKVNNRIEQDEIEIKQKAVKYAKIKFELLHGSINLRQVVIIFKGDTKQIVEVRKTIRAGMNREIRIDPDHGPIQKVVYNYDTKGIDAKKTKIKLYGSR